MKEEDLKNKKKHFKKLENANTALQEFDEVHKKIKN